MDQSRHLIRRSGLEWTVRILLPVLCIITLTLSIQAQTVRIFSPNGGENLVINTQTQIRWLANGLTSGILVEFSADSGATWTRVDSVTAHNGLDSLAWTVPSDTTHRALMRLTSGTKVSRSARVFNIVSHPVPVIQVLYPNGGEILQYDSTVKIRWNATNVSGQLDVQYSVDSGKVWKPISTVTAHDGLDSLTWTVPHDSSSKAFVRVRMTDSSAQDASNRVFSIRASVKPSIKLLYPNGGEVFLADSMTRIMWTAQDISGQLTVEYSVDNGKTWKPIGNRTARTGPDSLNWKVPNDSSTTALVRVGSAAARDTSDNVFTINGKAPAVPAVKLLYPNGGEQLKVDSVIYIRWQSANVTGSFMVFFSNDGGTAWAPVDSATAKAGVDSMMWTVPNFIGSQARLRIDWKKNTLSDTTDANFSIVPKNASGVAPEVPSSAQTLRLLGCFPNPASGSATVRWIQALPGTAMLTVNDQKGAAAMTVSAGYREAGEQEITLSTTSLPSGTYLYQLLVGTARINGRVTVVH
ncbi:MAG: hypothetical protein JST22_14845 [Bacteroidetes bacterium]|nr:hypothetical protein [Bacteroidota bacterium]